MGLFFFFFSWPLSLKRSLHPTPNERNAYKWAPPGVQSMHGMLSAFSCMCNVVLMVGFNKQLSTFNWTSNQVFHFLWESFLNSYNASFCFIVSFSRTEGLAICTWQTKLQWIDETPNMPSNWQFIEKLLILRGNMVASAIPYYSL